MIRDICNIIIIICLLVASFVSYWEGYTEVGILFFIALILVQIEDKLYQILQRFK